MRLFRTRGDEGPRGGDKVASACVFTSDRLVWCGGCCCAFSFVSQTKDAMRRGGETRGLTNSFLTT